MHCVYQRFIGCGCHIGVCVFHFCIMLFDSDDEHMFGIVLHCLFSSIFSLYLEFLKNLLLFHIDASRVVCVNIL
jgi:hypothetical protein